MTANDVEGLPLVVLEEDDAVRSGLRAALEDAGFPASSVSEAADLLETFAVVPDAGEFVVVLGADGAGGGALRVLGALQGALGRRAAVLVLARRGDVRAAVEAMRAGAENYLLLDEIDPASLRGAVLDAVAGLKFRRAHADSDASLRIAGDLRRHAGALLAVDNDLASVAFDRELAPRLPLGTAVVLTVHRRRRGERVEVSGEVRHRHDQGARIVYGIAPGDLCPGGFEALESMVERRTAFRLRPAEDRPLHLSVEIPEASVLDFLGHRGPRSARRWSGRVLDVSPLGLSWCLDGPADPLLEHHDVVQVRLALLEDAPLSGLLVRIRYRARENGMTRYGAELVPELTPDFPQLHESLLDWVFARQKEMLGLGPFVANPS